MLKWEALKEQVKCKLNIVQQLQLQQLLDKAGKEEVAVEEGGGGASEYGPIYFGQARGGPVGEGGAMAPRVRGARRPKRRGSMPPPPSYSRGRVGGTGSDRDALLAALAHLRRRARLGMSRAGE